MSMRLKFFDTWPLWKWN